MKHNAPAPIDNTRSLSACDPFGEFFFFFMQHFKNVKEEPNGEGGGRKKLIPPCIVKERLKACLKRMKQIFPTMCGFYFSRTTCDVSIKIGKQVVITQELDNQVSSPTCAFDWLGNV